MRPARRLEWAAVGPGTRSVFGTERDFEPGPDGRSFARVPLEPVRVPLIPVAGARK